MKFFFKFIFILVLVIAGMQFGVLTASAAGKVSADPETVTMDEDGDEEVVEVRLDQPIILPGEGDPLMTINISSDDSRVEISPASVTYLPPEWSQVREFTITTVGDLFLNPDNDVTITLSVVSDSEYYSGYETTVSVTLVDDEADTTPPDTFINSAIADSISSSTATFEFSSNEIDATFECSLDDGIVLEDFEPCTSPYTRSALAVNDYTLYVRAIDASNNIDSTPASEFWVISGIDVLSVSPVDGATNVDIDSTVTVTFSESVPIFFRLRTNIATSPCDPICPTLSDTWTSPTTLVFTNSEDFDEGTTYTMIISMNNGIAYEDLEEWSFTTESQSSNGGGGVVPLWALQSPQSINSPIIQSVISTQQLNTNNTQTFTFTRSLRQGMSGEDVKELQIFLNAQGFIISTIGAGSKGFESTYFGAKTKAALTKYQDAHRAEILTPVGLTKGSGMFGPSTMKFVNSVLNGN